MITRGPEGTAAVHRMIASPGAGGPTALRIMLGAQLRRLRETKQITLEDAGYVIRASGSKMSRLETGRVGFKPRDIADLLTFYGVTDDREREILQELARQASARGWWHDYADIMPAWFEPYVGLEEAASSIRCYEIQFVPGLLQTPDYARAVAAVGFPAGSAAEIERRVSLRMARQAVLTRPTLAHLWLVLDEAALRRPVGRPDVMRGQLRHLLDMAARPNVSLQIIPLARGAHAAAADVKRCISSKYSFYEAIASNVTARLPLTPRIASSAQGGQAGSRQRGQVPRSSQTIASVALR